jgi:hypothetical protein
VRESLKQATTSPDVVVPTKPIKGSHPTDTKTKTKPTKKKRSKKNTDAIDDLFGSL